MTAPALEVAVVVPAHEEDERIERCLASMRAATAHVAPTGALVRCVVVLDACTDRTGDRAEVAGAEVLEVAHRNVGRARAAGFAHALRTASVAEGDLWLATTDADTEVPRSWLARQLAWRARGVQALAGTVAVRDWAEQPARVRERFERHQRSLGLGLDHGHVHGANLGLAATAYRAAGGVPPLEVAEDHALWDAVGTAGCRRLKAPDLRVVTSSRRDGRAPGGFSDLLRSL